MNREQPTQDQVTSWLSQFLTSQFEVDPARIRPEADIYRDLDLDSIDAADIVLKFNETFGTCVDMRAFRDVRTVRDALAILNP